MNQDDLAREAGLSKRTIGNYENGRVPESAPIVPDGYFDVARVLGWTAGSVDIVLAGGEPKMSSDIKAADARAVEALVKPVFEIADLARDADAPEELVTRFRTSAIELVGWLASSQHKGAGRLVGPGVQADDAELIISELEDGDTET